MSNAVIFLAFIISSNPVAFCRAPEVDRSDPRDPMWICPKLAECSPFGHGNPLGSGGDFGCSVEGKDVAARVVLRNGRISLIIPKDGTIIKTWPSGRIRVIETYIEKQSPGAVWYYFPDESKYSHIDAVSFLNGEPREVRSYDSKGGDLYGKVTTLPDGRCIIDFTDTDGTHVRQTECNSFP